MRLRVVLAVVFIFVQAANSKNVLDRELTKKLLTDYEVTTRPSKSYKDTVNVTMDVALREVVDLDEAGQTLSLKVWVRMSWYDYSLTWNVSEFDGVTHTEVLASSIWRPDIVLYNNAPANPFSLSDEDVTAFLVGVTHKGKITFNFPVTLTSACTLDVTYFPFDIQTCNVTFASWVFKRAQLDLYHPSGTPDSSVYEASNEFKLLKYGVIRRVSVYPTGEFPELTFQVVLERRPLYIVFNLVLPVIMIAVIGMLAFCLPPDDGEKIGLCVTMMVALSFIMLLLGDKMPPTSTSIPLLGEFFAAIVIMLALTTLLSTLVIHVHFRGWRSKRVPKWIRVVVLKGLARFLCFDMTCKNDMYKDDVGNLTSHSMNGFANLGLSEDDKNANSKDNSVQLIDGPVLQQIKEKLHRLETVLADRLKPADDDEQNLIDTEWRQVAMVIDRLFLIMYFLGLVLVSLAMLLRRQDHDLAQ